MRHLIVVFAAASIGSSAWAAPASAPPKLRSCAALPQTHTLQAAEVEAAFAAGWGTQVRVVPAYQGGRNVGLKVFGVRPGTLAERIGLCSGDVILSVDGRALDGPEQALAAYAALRGDREVHARVLRDGVESDLHLRVAPAATPPAVAPSAAPPAVTPSAAPASLGPAR